MYIVTDNLPSFPHKERGSPMKAFMSFVCLIALLAAPAVFSANSLSTGGHNGILRSQSADPLGEGVLHTGGALEYSQEYDYIKAVNAARNGSPKLLSGVGYLGIGLLPKLDIGFNLPVYYDRPNFGSSNAKGIGDLELSAKLSDFWLNGDEKVLTGAYYLALQFPTGNNKDGFFPRHAYYGNEGNWSSINTIIHPMLASTIHFDRLKSPVPMRLHLNFGGAFNTPDKNNALTGSIGFEAFPNDWLTLFTELSGEERVATIHKEHPFADLINDPIYLTPGVKIIDKKTGLYFTLAGDIGISEKDAAYAQTSYTETGKTVLHQANFLYNAYFAIGWQKPSGPKDTDKDGIFDPEDNCPEVAGIIENKGCPDKDTDKDGIVDRLDKCPNDAEDKDAFEDEDGCPDLDNDKDSVADALDKCPNVAGLVANNGCADIDSDKDGIADRLDNCPNEAEDKDGFRDDDGCADPDNDNDGILDDMDKCPNNPGTTETQGCPKSKEITRGALILKGVNFESGKAVLLAGSYTALNEMAESLREWPEIKLEVSGHTDNSGKAVTNQILSQERAETVRQYLIDKGISADRLTAVGYGQDRPIADNKTATGRAQNRRVEINRTN
jgi:outer membrane protein OmpA-like peptidoglycan-associated protein